MDSTQECPLCLEELDGDDKRFFPCTCSYQICRFCWHHLKSLSTDDYPPPSCPACRKPYGDAPAKYKPIRLKKKAPGSQPGSQWNKAGQSARVSSGQAASGNKGGQTGGKGNQGLAVSGNKGGQTGGKGNQGQAASGNKGGQTGGKGNQGQVATGNKGGQTGGRGNHGRAVSGNKGGQNGGQGNHGQAARMSQGPRDQGGRANHLQGN